jgi:hypothetical protein
VLDCCVICILDITTFPCLDNIHLCMMPISVENSHVMILLCRWVLVCRRPCLNCDLQVGAILGETVHLG